jgi:4-aminobutyrate aminotransferase/(S)-3-amino-2-methylpropionate transaminase
VACAAALAVLDVIERDDICARSRRIGDVAIRRMRAMQQRHDCIGDVRGIGAMTAMELVRHRSSREPDADLTVAILREAHARGLALLRAGLHDNVIRLLMPLTISDDELTAGLDILEQSLEAVSDAEPIAITRNEHAH